jgi:pullulanase/glycogen debranching enzyme
MNRHKRRRPLASVAGILILSFMLVAPLVTSTPARADHTPDPTGVAIVSSLQDELGCPGDWQPECAAAELAFDAEDDVWQQVFSVPAGSWEYKAALNDSWDENYGANAQSNGANIPLSLTDPTDVRFYYDHKSHWITDNQNSVIATAAGSFQSELGCAGDWDPGCLRSWLQDPDGDGLYSFSTSDIPAGDYEGKVAINESWDENYGAGGVQNGPNIPFTVGANQTVTFAYDAVSHVLTISTAPTPPPGPSSVTIAGSLQSELGCSGDWQANCAATHLTYDWDDDVWQDTFNVPVGDWEYKAALNDSWDENYGANAQPNGANIALNLVDPTDVKFYYDHKSHWVTDNVNSVIATASGSFQSELGCPDDWQPWCLRSWLQDADGDGVYVFQTSDIPPGGYEFKVAINEAWDTSYPGANVSFSVSNDGDIVIFTYDSSDNSVDITVTPGVIEVPPEIAALVTATARNPIQDDVFYFVMPDRFANGSEDNNTGGIPGDRLEHGFDPTDKGFFHGGDLAGLTDKLDYLADMGITSIWMTPVFKNNPVQGTGADVSAGYHGYWYLDMTQFDPHFGTNEELETLIDQAHVRGIKVFFDIITNHTADILTYEEGTFTYRNKTDFPYRMADGTPFEDRDYAGGDTFPDLDPAVSFPYTPAFSDPADATLKVPAWLNAPIYYHNRGNSSFSGENSLYGDFFGLDDLWTEHPDVVQGMLDIYKDWITNYDIDGFRVDTVKHVNLEFWQQFAPEILAHAAVEGKPDFFIFGEVFSGNPVLLSHYTSRAEFPAVLDFRFQEQVRSYVSGGGASDMLRDLFADDDYFTDADSNVYALPTFIGNHDRGRFGWFLDADNGTLPDAEKVARSQLAHAFMYFARGVPVIYYGDEQGFVGDGGDKDARQDMFPSQVPSYNDDDLIGTDATTAQDNFDPTHPLYSSFADYADIYQAHPALRTGAQLHRYSQNSAGIYAFSRIDRDEQVEYIVAFNNANSAQSASFGTDSPDTSFAAVYPTSAPAIISDPSGQVSVNVPELSFVIYKADAPLSASDAAPGIAFSTLSNDQEVALETPVLDGNDVQDRIEVGVSLTNDRFSEVTFAVRKSGTSDYTVIGVDDNAPYRVFFALDDLPGGFNEGDALDFVAIVSDLNGNLNYAEVTGIKPVLVAPGGAVGAAPYAVIHYFREDGDYGDHTTGDYNDFWGLHLWGDIDETIAWTSPKPFLGEDEYGRFAWVKLAPGAQNVGFIVHRGDTKDGTDADRFFNPSTDGPEIWLKGNDPNFYTSQAEAQGFVTIRYHRPDGDYGDPTSPDFNDFWGLHLWGDAIDPSEGTGWTTPKPFDGVDDYGAFWNILIADATQPVNFIIHRGDEKNTDPDESFIPQEIPTVWKQIADETIYASRGAAENVATIHYHRDDGDYGDPTSPNFNDFWGLHVWEGALSPNPSWQDPVRPVGFDIYGPFFEVALQPDATQLAYIIHRGDTKDPGPDQFLMLDESGYEVWQLEGVGPDPDKPHYVLPITGVGAAPGNLDTQKAHWVAEDRIVWAIAGDPAADYQLCYAPIGGLALDVVEITGGSCIELVPVPPFPTDVDGFRHLAGLPTLKIAADDLALVPDILKGQIAVLAVKDGVRVDAAGLQIPGVLDDLYTYSGELGVSWDGDVPTIRVWAPTAKSVTFHLFDDADPATTSTTTPMTLDPDTGVWSIAGDASWKGEFYLFEVEVYVHSTGQVEHNLVTDPYSFSLAMNSTRSQIVDLNDAALKPDGWEALQKPELTAPEDISIYEIHVRDFSVNDPSVPEELKGTYKAFTLEDTYGVNHLQALQQAGLSHLHLLPVFDIATINENKAEWQAADWGELETFAPDSDQQQALVTQYEELDGFNWGYDPFHYTTPEGSYSTNPDGVTRIIEFREMVQALNGMGLRVVMDVVYNHTNSAGQAEKSVLDRIVPGYYHRLNDQGQVETSTCCQNTASEHNMMEKLMVDSLVTWATQYKIDAFRFDLMGHHSLANMLNVRANFDALTPAEDGVDGSSIYIYGEGWNFGEVANDARFIQATQLNLGGSGIGSFSDRLRDAVRGGGPFDSGQDLIRRQGFANGLLYDPNALNTAPEPAPEPASVTIPGSLQSELGCTGDWQPDCVATHLTFDADDTVWQRTFAVPAGSWAYKATLNDSWDENYGANAERNGANIPLNLSADTDVKFYYSHATHWVIDNVNAVIATAPGDYQDEIGCPGDWQPDCLRSWLQDPDGDGTFTFSTSDIPPGSYEAKVTIDESWDENYGAGGVQNGPNIPFTVEPGQTVRFSYDGVSHVLTISFEASDQLAELFLLTDQIRVGMAGNLAGYQFIDRNGNLVTGAQVDYNGQPAGYTADPQEDITYISKHDNQTLYDNNTYKAPIATSMADRVRIQNVGLSTVLLGQGVPFMHAGSDLLRSKSFDRDSFNSGDWFNKLDFTYQSNNYGVGLPVAGKNQENWPIMQPLLANPDLNPAPADIEFSAALYQELLQIRYSSPLFRLETAGEIQQRVAFHNTGLDQLPGLIVMSLSDLVAPDLDRGHELFVVLINANDEAQTITLPELAGKELALHLVQVTSVDAVVKTSAFDSATGSFTLPGRTAAVFEFAPQEMIRSLIEDIEALRDAGILNKGQANALIVKLETAIKNLDKGKANTALNELNAFINQVYAFVSAGTLTPEEAQHLIDAANAISDQIRVRYQVP